MTKYTLRPVEAADQALVAQLLTKSWGSPSIVIGRNRVVQADTLPGLIASQDGETVGLLTFFVDGKTAELATINAYKSGDGIGTALIEAMTATVRELGCDRIILMTTNDNTEAISFYQQRGFHLSELRVGAIAEARALKPQIPLIGTASHPDPRPADARATSVRTPRPTRR